MSKVTADYSEIQIVHNYGTKLILITAGSMTEKKFGQVEVMLPGNRSSKTDSLTIKGYLVKITQHSIRVRAEIAQLVEHATENRSVASPILALGTRRDIHSWGVSFVQKMVSGKECNITERLTD